MSQRLFLMTLDVSDETSPEEVASYLERLVVSASRPGTYVAVQEMVGGAVFADRNTIVLRLPILPEPPRLPAQYPAVMTVHTERRTNWISPNYSRVNALGYLAMSDDIPLPDDRPDETEESLMSKTRKKTEPRYRCPKCKGDSLDVVVRCWQMLVQDKDGNTQTDFSSNPETEWDETSAMRCRSCGHAGMLGEFDARQTPVPKEIRDLGGLTLTEPLRPRGEKQEGEDTYWLGRADILGASFHVELHQVRQDGDQQVAVGKTYDKLDDLMNLAGDGNFETIQIGGKIYVLVIYPFCR